MSITKNKKNQIIDYMLEQILRNNNVVDKVSDSFNLSKTTIYRYLSELENQNIINKKGRGKYELSKTTYHFKYNNNGQLEEDYIYNEDIAPLLKDLPDNVRKIWIYAFTEMFNNAIEHSESDIIQCFVECNHIETTIMITDFGIGIFKKIQDYFKYNSVDDAINELFKGKLTTDTNNHSGEGIFFTSRLMDQFSAISGGKFFTHSNHSEFLNTLKEDDDLNLLTHNKGTVIYMRLANRSHKQLVEVFDMFSDVDNGFNKTSIPMKNIYGNSFPVSRSQARRLYNRLDQFSEVELDFNGVDEIGQAFAHELFVKFASNHPEVKLNVVNSNEKIDAMINHVRNTK